MTDAVNLTPFKLRVLAALLEVTDNPSPGWNGHTGRSLAGALWPNSPAWKKRTRGSDAHAGGNAMAGTMPMKGARAGHELARLGLAHVEYSSHSQPFFTISSKGRRVLAASK